MTDRRPRHAKADEVATAGGRSLRVAAAALAVVALPGGAWAIAVRDDSDGEGAPVETGSDPTDPSTSASTAPTTATTATTAPSTSTTIRDPFLGNGEPVTLAFGGDTNFEGAIADRRANDPGSIFGGFAPVLAAADVAVVNMETAIGIGGTPAPKDFVFQVGPEALEAFRLAGVDVVSAARAAADTVVVFLHWGTETHTCPNEAQLILSEALVAAGADVIVGGHAHRLQGGGRLGNAVVHYGLGNFAFYSGSGEGARTGVLTVTITGRRVDGYQWIPGQIVDRRPEPLEGGAAAEALARWEAQRDCTNLTP